MAARSCVLRALLLRWEEEGNWYHKANRNLIVNAFCHALQ